MTTLSKLAASAVVALSLVAGGCASSSESSNATMIEATSGLEAAEAAARSALAANNIRLNEAAEKVMSGFGARAAGVVLISGESEDGSDVAVSITKAGVNGEVNVAVTVDDPEDEALEATISDAIRSGLNEAN